VGQAPRVTRSFAGAEVCAVTPEPQPRAQARFCVTVNQSDVSPLVFLSVTVLFRTESETRSPNAGLYTKEGILAHRRIDLLRSGTLRCLYRGSFCAMIGQTLGHYRIIEKIGAGGMGEVYRAHDEHLGRDVAIKVLPSGTLADEEARKRFRKEALILGKLNHPNIETVFEFNTQNGLDFLAMELIPGAPVSSRIKDGLFPEQEIVRLAGQLTEGLAAAHAQGVIHRDLKPGNLFVTLDGRLKILDFGLAKLIRSSHASDVAFSTTETGTVSGTVPYMSPEQLRGLPVDNRSDIYAVGTVLYEMATGQRPFPQTHVPELMSAILHQSPPPPSSVNRLVSPAFERIINKALAKDPSQRYQSALELRSALEVLGSRAEDLPTAPVTSAVPQAFAIGSADMGTPRPRRLPVVGSLVIALVLIFWAVNAFHLRERFFASPISPHIHSIAVLPLANLSDDPLQNYFADGMTEELINALSQISALRVISHASVMQYKDVHKPIAQIAQELNVDAIVEGTVQRSDSRVKISADLVDARTDRNLWGHSYEGDLHDVLSLQSQAAQAIAEEIQVQLTPQESAALSKRQAVDPQAYQTYLRARYLWNRRTPEDLRSALDEFTKAIDQDPTFALAWSGLADVYTLLASQGEMPPREAMPPAEAAANKALQLDDSLAQAHAALAVIDWTYQWNRAGAEEEFARAIALNPSYATAREWHGLYLNYIGQFDEALEEMRRAQELDPLSLVIQANVGRCYYYARRYDKAIELSKQMEQKESNFWIVPAILGQTYLVNSRFDDAIRELERALTLSPSTLRNLGVLGDAYGRAERRSDALKIAAELDTLSRTRYVPPVYSALVYMGIGDKTRAFAFLDKAYTERSEWMVELNFEPEFDPLRVDPRFQTLLRRVAQSELSTPR
jgi:eukaryotic-like serine/threonine-protein kinase